MKQKVSIKNPENPLEEKFVEMDVEAGIKILSDEDYVKEAYAKYMGFIDPKDCGDIDDNSISKGFISNVTDQFATVELNKKYSTVIDITKEKKEYLSYIQPHAVLDLKINKERNSYNASFSNAIHDIKLNEIVTAIGTKVAYYAKVVELIHGGYYLTIDGIKVFMPGSLAGMNKLSNFDELLGKEIYVMPINYSNNYNMVVVSHREYLKSLKPMELERVKTDVEYKGKVTGASKFGVFAEFNTDNDLTKPFILTGLIPSSEMDDATLEKFNRREFEPGSDIKFYVKNVVSDKKIILTKIFIDWAQTFKEYTSGREVDCKIIKIQENIIFAVIDDTKLIGTITNYDKDCEVGDIIKLKISKIDKESKKIFLKR
jgi:ribosomal protein S1